MLHHDCTGIGERGPAMDKIYPRMLHKGSYPVSETVHYLILPGGGGPEIKAVLQT